MAILGININLAVIILDVTYFRLLVDYDGNVGIYATVRKVKRHSKVKEQPIKVFVFVKAVHLIAHLSAESVLTVAPEMLLKHVTTAVVVKEVVKEVVISKEVVSVGVKISHATLQDLLVRQLSLLVV